MSKRSVRKKQAINPLNPKEYHVKTIFLQPQSINSVTFKLTAPLVFFKKLAACFFNEWQ